MFVRIILIYFIAFYGLIPLHAQQEYASEYSTLERLEIYFDDDPSVPNIYLPYLIKPRNTIFGIAEFFNISPYSLKATNPQIKHTGLQPGDRIVIPFPKNRISQEKTSVRLDYMVNRKDTWYGIAKRHLNKSPQELQSLNRDMGMVLRPGQPITIGYISAHVSSKLPEAVYDALPPQSTITETPEVRDTVLHAQAWLPIQYSMRNTFLAQQEKSKVKQLRGKAIWRGGSSDDAFYVLHPTASIGSIIEIHNPMSRSKIYAKVIGRIPAQAYPADIQLVVSASVARHLGVLDPQFFAKTYFTMEGAG